MRQQACAVVATVYGILAASSPAAASREGPWVNRYGAPVVTDDGRPILYTRAELEAQAARLPAEEPAAAVAVDPIENETATPTGIAAVPVWAFAGFGQGIGKGGISLAGEPGTVEIHLGGSTTTFGDDDYWYSLRYDPDAGDYRQVHVSPRYAAGIRRIVLADAVGDAAREIVVALADGRVLLHDARTRLVTGAIATAAGDLRGLGVRDVDGDGAPEILVCNRTHLYVYSADGSLEWEVPVGGLDLAVGQLDGDGALEIAVTEGAVVDAGSRAVQWQWSAGFGAILETADIDDDGIEELIAAETWYFVWSYDVDRRLPKWSIPVDLDVASIGLSDVDGDGVLELLVGERQRGEIDVFDTVSQAREWSIGSPYSGVADMAVGDVDGDGELEILWGTGHWSTGPDRLLVADLASRQIEWESMQLEGPFLGPRMGDLDGDGVPEIVTASRESDAGHGSGRIVVFDSTLRLRAISDGIAGGGSVTTGCHDLELRDVDGDGRLEILVGTSRLYRGVIEVYDFEPDDRFVLNWTNAIQPDGTSFYSVEAADVDGDGEMEIVGGVGREHTGAAGVFVYVYDYATGLEEWHSIQMGGYWDEIVGLRLGDFDRDGAPEIVGMVDGGDVYVYDGPTSTLEAILEGRFTYLTSIAGVPYLLLGTSDGDVVVQAFTAGAYTEVFRARYESGPVDGLSFGWNAATLWTASAGVLHLVEPGAYSLATGNYGQKFGRDVLFYPGIPFFISGGGYGIMGFWIVAV